ncbi:hypothetical protein ACIA74_39320 [Streptomyces sp. NPDC051658]|uniref:hypothetical protein n=1 Tax=Streptomyces sp. NPDC051658 TaxID=3365667 RepID=UPI003790CF62
MNRCQFIADHQRRFGVTRLCSLLGLSRSNFYHWRRTAAARTARQAADSELAARIRRKETVGKLTEQRHADLDRLGIRW